jgi:hypothetical protein
MLVSANKVNYSIKAKRGDRKYGLLLKIYSISFKKQHGRAITVAILWERGIFSLPYLKSRMINRIDFFT